MVHLEAFRTGIAACALISGLVLNGLTGWWLLRMASRNAPPLYREYRMWLIGGGIGCVLRPARAGGCLTYPGLGGPRSPPAARSVGGCTLTLAQPSAGARPAAPICR